MVDVRSKERSGIFFFVLLIGWTDRKFTHRLAHRGLAKEPSSLGRLGGKKRLVGQVIKLSTNGGVSYW